MLLSLRWINSFFSPGDLTPGVAEDVLTHLGFPVESWEGDRFDLEVTSNRGDMLCHLGAARELAAKTGRRLILPPGEVMEDPGAGVAATHLGLENNAPAACPLFLARVVRGVKVGPSPAWLRERLESVGQRSINNVVDVTNFNNFELGNPCHAFDMAKLAGGGATPHALHIRWARDKEPLKTLDGKQRTLRADELVVADGARAQSLAGVIGGGDSEVSEGTTDVVLEVATWSPGVVRRAARRHGVRTDASHRFERTVDARTLEFAVNRGAALIAEVAGGRVCTGVLRAGGAMLAPTRVRFRPRRCTSVLGIEVATEEMVRLLNAVGVEVGPIGRGGEEWSCTIPAHRPDLTREVDLIEEVARVKGLDAIPVQDMVRVAVRPPQASEAARRMISSTLTGLGFFETVTFSFTSAKEAGLFLSGPTTMISVDDARRGEEPVLRPSLLAGLCATRRKNQHAQASVPGGVRLFEMADVFGQLEGATRQGTMLSLLMDVAAKGKTASFSDVQQATRLMRGVIDTLAGAVAGPGASVTFRNANNPIFADATAASVSLGESQLGTLGLLHPRAQTHYDLHAPVIVAELDPRALLGAYPPRGRIAALPAFPAIERDLSVVVDEGHQWGDIDRAARAGAIARLENVDFVGIFRGPQVGKGRKSVTLRLRFRDPARTLRNEEVDGPVAEVVAALKTAVGAELRA